jgi:proliferating cell nuclear antigen
MVTEVEVKTETENQKEKESQTEYARNILDYDEGFKPEYRNKMKAVNLTEQVPEIPEEEDVVAQDDEETVLKAGEPKEQNETEDTVKNSEPENFRDAEFTVTMATDTWNQVIKLLKVITTEVRFKWTADGIRAVAVDNAHVAMYDITILNEVLKERVAEEDTEFALDIDMFPKLKNGGNFTMSRRKNEIAVDFDGVSQSVKQLDIDSILYPKILPKLEQQCSATVKIEPFRKFFNAAESINDAFKMTMHAEGILILASRSDDKKAEVVLNRENSDLLDINMSGEQTVRSYYPLEYIQKVVKAATTVTEMEIAFRTDYPLAVSFKLPAVVKKDKGKYPTGMIPVKFLLAPRMEQ